MKKLRVFACDHRCLGDQLWQYPFERIGTGFTNDCKLKDIDEPSICNEKTNKFFSEYTAIWWLWKHLKQIEVSDFIGFVHYRRFFTTAKPNFGAYPLFVVQNELTLPDIKQLVPNEEQLFHAIRSNDLDGILPTPFPDHGYVKQCKDIVDLMFKESCIYKLGFDKDSCNMMFDVLDKYMKYYFSKDCFDKIRKCMNTFHFNIFVLSLKLFDMYNQILEKTVFEVNDELSKRYLDLNPRALSYAIERFSSSIFIAMMLSNAKFGYMPLLLVENKDILQ